jgi:hypothetical protein
VTYDNWPWGKQHCNLNFGSWTFDADQYDLQFHDNKVIYALVIRPSILSITP